MTYISRSALTCLATIGVCVFCAVTPVAALFVLSDFHRQTVLRILKNADGLKREREKVMKKIVVFITLILALIMCMVSCQLSLSGSSNSGHIHEFGEWSTTQNATCTIDGEKVRYCSCGEKQIESIKALSHNVVIDQGFDATCVKTGITEGRHCSVCNEILVAQTMIDAFGHTEEIDEYVAPTCASTGLTAGKHCYVCNEILVAQTTIDALPHTEVVDAAVPPTCTAAGISEGKHCSVCNGTIVAQTIVDALGHTEVVDVAVSSTCTETGLTEGKHCSVCNEVFVAQIETSKVSHSYDDKYDEECNECGFIRDAECAHTNVHIQPAKSATCTEPGLTEGKVCVRCEEIIVAQTVINALGHTEVILAAVAPTCTETGLTEGKKCSSCDASIIAQSIVKATGHTPVVDPAVEPTATTTGLTEGSHCSVCNTVLVKQEIIDVIKVFNIYYVLSGGTLNTDLYSYNTEVGVSEEDMPIPIKDGYEFKGWYTTSYYSQESLVRDIPEGTKIDYRLYAKWELATYNVYCINAGKNIEPISYNMNTQLVLNNPEWSGLIFTHWTDQNGKEYTPNGDLTFFPEKMTGNLTLTANWKSKQNLVTPFEGEVKLYNAYSGEDGFLYFFCELGTIENVVLEKGDVYKKNSDVGDELTISTTKTISEENATSIANTVSKSISSTASWEESKNWSETHSESWNASIGGEIEAGWPLFKVKLKETFGFGGEDSNTKGLIEAVGGSTTDGTTEENSVSSTFAYTEEISITKSHSYTISGDLPNGYYVYVYAGDVRVFAAISYEIATGNMYLDTYSVLDDVYPTVMYYENVDQYDNMISNSNVEGLDFDIPKDEIVNIVEKSYYIKYDANGGKGTMPTTMHTVDVAETLPECAFTRVGYKFLGWEVNDSDELLKNGEQIKDLCEAQKTITLKAIWESIEYDIEYNLLTQNSDYAQNVSIDNKGNITRYTVEDSIIINTPSRGVYDIFQGWYEDAEFTIPFVNDLNEKPRSITLYAKWDLVIYYNTIEGTPKISAIGDRTRVVVDWSGYSGTHNYRTAIDPDADGIRNEGGNLNIDISNNMTEIYFIGNTNAFFEGVSLVPCFFNNEQSLNLKFKDFMFSSTSNSIWGYECGNFNLNMEFSGENQIFSTSGSAICKLINVNITGSGNLKVFGAHGAYGGTYATGGSGQAGIIVNYLTINTSGNIYITGGNGADGGNTSTDRDRSNSLRTAGSGGNGGDAISCVSCTITGNVTITAGKGGSGGYAYKTKNNAGIGGDGGNGGHGIRYLETCSVSGNVTSVGGIAGSGGGAEKWNWIGDDSEPGDAGSSGLSFYKS